MTEFSFEMSFTAILFLYFNQRHPNLSPLHIPTFYPNHSTTGTLGYAHWRIFSGTLGFYPHDTSNTLPLNCGSQKCLQMLPNVPWGVKSLPVENHFLQWPYRKSHLKLANQNSTHSFRPTQISPFLWKYGCLSANGCRAV